MTGTPMKRGERMARWMIGRLDAAGVEVEPLRQNGEWALKLPASKDHTPEQRAVATDAALMALGHPRNFATMCKILEQRRAA